MLRLDLPFTDTSLLLNPRFGNQPAALQALLLLLCFVPVGLMAWLYRYELRLVRPAVARTLLGLRLLVVLLIVFVIGFQPVAAHGVTETVLGRVLIALDRSDSMAVTDPQRPLVEKLRLARALRLVKDFCPDGQLDAWIKQVDQSGQIPWPIGGPGTPDADRRLFDRVCQRVDALTRAQAAHAVLAADGIDLLAMIARHHRPHLLGFAAAGSDLDPARLDDLPPVGEAGAYTDLRIPLTRGQEQDGGAGGQTLAVVLLSDGQHNDPDTPVEKAIELGQQGVPVYPIALGSRVAPTDIIVTTAQAPSSVFKGADVTVEARVEVRGLSAREVVVELQRPNKPPLTERIIHDGTDRGHTVRFQTRLDDVGTQVLTVAARAAPEETRPENNTRPLAVNVADDKAKVLLIDGEARWEFHYLASALARDRSMDVKSVLFEQPRTGRLSDDQLSRIGHPAQRLPSEPDALADYDCIVLGDVAPGQLPADERIRLEKYVSERGGTLVILAGKRAMPQAFTRRDADAGDPIQKLLPIEEPRAVDAVEGFPVVPTAEGKLAGFLQMEPTPEASERRWAALPRHYWGVVGRAKPGAAVLASYREVGVAEPNDPGAWEKDNALIARQSYGFGRVLYVGLESTWRWRFKAGDTYHHRFWGQAMRWAASDKPLVAGNEFVRFGPRKPVVEYGQEVELGVRFSELARKLPPEAPAAVRVLRLRDGKPDEQVATVNLQRPEARPRELEAKVRDLPPGQYAAELVIPDLADQLNGPPGPDGRPAPLRALFSVSPRESTEMTDLATNLPLLEEIAAKSGGKVFTTDTASELGELLTQRAATRSYSTETKLWQAWPTLAAFLALLTIEWLARKWAGLP